MSSSQMRMLSLYLQSRWLLICTDFDRAFRPENIQERDRYDSRRIVARAVILYNGYNPLNVLETLTMIAGPYITEVPIPYV